MNQEQPHVILVKSAFNDFRVVVIDPDNLLLTKFVSHLIYWVRRGFGPDFIFH